MRTDWSLGATCYQQTVDFRSYPTMSEARYCWSVTANGGEFVRLLMKACVLMCVNETALMKVDGS